MLKDSILRNNQILNRIEEVVKDLNPTEINNNDLNHNEINNEDLNPNEINNKDPSNTLNDIKEKKRKETEDIIRNTKKELDKPQEALLESVTKSFIINSSITGTLIAKESTNLLGSNLDNQNNNKVDRISQSAYEPTQKKPNKKLDVKSNAKSTYQPSVNNIKPNNISRISENSNDNKNYSINSNFDNILPAESIYEKPNDKPNDNYTEDKNTKK